MRKPLIDHLSAVYKYNFKESFKNDLMTFNLSQDEIDAIQKELEESLKQFNLPKATDKDNDFMIYTPGYYSTQKTTLKAQCDHKWKSYIGLNETFVYCEICDQKQ